MLNVNHLIGFGAGGEIGGPIINRIQGLGLASNLVLCLDAGDANSYTSGQKWLDVSGNGYDFYRGTSASSEGSDPTFNGTPGGNSVNEYWSFDGGDYFTYDSSNETWMTNLHKAGAVFTCIVWAYRASANHHIVFSTCVGVSTTGVYLNLLDTGGVQFVVVNGSSVVAAFSSAVGSHPTSTWKCYGISVDVPSNSQIIMNDGQFATGSAVYTSPSTGNSSTMKIGAFTDNTTPLPNGARIQSLPMWTRALSQSEMGVFFQNTRGIF